MRRRWRVRSALGAILDLAVTLGELHACMPKMGYCFGVALSETGDQLLVACGIGDSTISASAGR